MTYSSVERYSLPKQVSKGLGWTSLGTICLGDTKAYLAGGSLMPQNDGIIYGWASSLDIIGKHAVEPIGAIVGGKAVLSYQPTIVPVKAVDEIVGIEAGLTVILPKDSIFSAYFGSGCGQVISCADKLSPIYIGGADSSSRFSNIEGEGMILDNTIVSLYSVGGIFLGRNVGASVKTHIENTILDDRTFTSLAVSSAYTGSLTFINNTVDGEILIEDEGTPSLDIRNNRVESMLINSTRDYTNLIRNNYIGILTLTGGAICPDKESVGKHWHTISTPTEMESYRGNIVGSFLIPSFYGYLRGYGKIYLGVGGGLPYLSPVASVSWTRQEDNLYVFYWKREQSEEANSYRISLTTDRDKFPVWMDRCVDVGNRDSFTMESQKTILTRYPIMNDGNKDGVADNLLDLTLNNVWYSSVQSQTLLGNRLMCHLSDVSTIMAIPTYNKSAKPPNESFGFSFPVKISSGNFVYARGRDSVRSGVFQTVLTNVGERVLHEHGAGLRAFLFEGVLDDDLVDIAREHLRSELESVETRIKVVGIYFKAIETQDGGNGTLVNIVYKDLETGEQNSFSTGLNYGK